MLFHSWVLELELLHLILLNQNSLIVAIYDMYNCTCRGKKLSTPRYCQNVEAGEILMRYKEDERPLDVHVQYT